MFRVPVDADAAATFENVKTVHVWSRDGKRLISDAPVHHSGATRGSNTGLSASPSDNGGIMLLLTKSEIVTLTSYLSKHEPATGTTVFLSATIH